MDMSECMRLPLLAEAIIMNAVQNFQMAICPLKNEDSELVDNVENILATVEYFKEAFTEIGKEIFVTHCLKDFSEKDFIDFVIPKLYILSKKKTFFNLMLVCGFMGNAAYYFLIVFKCYHLLKVASKCLLHFIKIEFENLLKTEIQWECLYLYCNQKHDIMFDIYYKPMLSDLGKMRLENPGLAFEENCNFQQKSEAIGDSKIVKHDTLHKDLTQSVRDSENDKQVKGKQQVLEGIELIENIHNSENVGAVQDKLKENPSCSIRNSENYVEEKVSSQVKEMTEIDGNIDQSKTAGAVQDEFKVNISHVVRKSESHVEEKGKQNVQGAEVIEKIDCELGGSCSNSSFLPDQDIHNDKPKKPKFMFQLLTDCPEQFDEVRNFIDICIGSLEPDMYSMDFYIFLSEKHNNAATFEDGSDSRKQVTSIDPKVTNSNRSGSFPEEETDGNFRLTQSDMSIELVECPYPDLPDANQIPCDSSSKRRRKKRYDSLEECCTICKRTKDQYLKKWCEVFVKKYPELLI